MKKPALLMCLIALLTGLNISGVAAQEYPKDLGVWTQSDCDRSVIRCHDQEFTRRRAEGYEGGRSNQSEAAEHNRCNSYYRDCSNGRGYWKRRNTRDRRPYSDDK